MIFLTVLKKNFQLLTNKKFSTFILIVGPILLIALIGLSLQDTSLKNVKASVFSEVEESLTKELLEKLDDSQIRGNQVSSLNDCKESVINGVTDICMHFVEDFENKKKVGYSINLYVDFSKQRTVWSMIGRVQAIGESESEKARDSLIKEIKDVSSDVIEKISEQQENINVIIRNMEIIQTKVDTSKAKKYEILSEVGDVKFKLSEMSKDAYMFSVQHPESSYFMVEISNELNEAVQILTNVDKEVSSMDFIYVERKISDAMSGLSEVNGILEDVKVDVEEINSMNFDRVTDPVVVTHQSVLDDGKSSMQKDLEFLDYLFPSFLIFFIVFNAIIFSSNTRIKERKSNAYIRNIASEVSGRKFIFADLFSSFFIIFIQSMLIIYCASYFLNINIFQNIYLIIGILMVCVFVFCLIGITIGSIFSTTESSTIASICVSILFFIFSSIITPLETVPEGIASVIKMLPLTILENKLRMLTIFNSNIFLLREIISILGTVIICFILIFYFYKKNKVKEI